MTRQFDFLIIGSGVAGLTFALRVAEHGSVGIVTKKESAESNTNYAQGGVAAVVGTDDSFARHEADLGEQATLFWQSLKVEHVLDQLRDVPKYFGGSV